MDNLHNMQEEKENRRHHTTVTFHAHRLNVYKKMPKTQLPGISVALQMLFNITGITVHEIIENC